MVKAISRSNLMLVELDKGVLVRTSIPSDNHPALRAGFAGYTSNPRWCASKFVAWRTGRMWRDALDSGKLAVRQSDLMLVPVEEISIETESQTKQKISLLSKLRHQTPSMSGIPKVQGA